MLAEGGRPALVAYGFEPSVERVALLDQRMRDELHDSLKYVFRELGSHVQLDQSSLEGFLRRVKEAPVTAQTFALYGEVVLSIDEDDLEEAKRLVDLLLTEPAPPSVCTINPIGNLQTDPAAARLIRFVDNDPTIHFEIRQADPALAESARKKILDAFAVLEKVDPELAAETRAIIREIVLAGGPEDTSVPQYEAASSLMLWGCVLINVDWLGDILDVVQTLAHESAHNLLFGLSPGDPLVTNDLDELYSSPVRRDPRPMEGIYHAAFVTARMHRVLQRLLVESGVLDEAQATQARTQMAARVRSFAAGIATIHEHGKLTPVGKLILDGAIASMPPAPAA